MSDLSEFLKKKQEEYQQEQADWNLVKLKRMDQLERFMECIKSWLEQPEKEGLVEVNEKKVEIIEEKIGKYEAPALELLIGGESVEITPVGRFIIGASGRVDIISFTDRYITLHHSEKGWIYRKEGKQSDFQEFTEGNFVEILKDAE